MSKDGLIRLPDKVAAALLQALESINAVRDYRLVLQRPERNRPPNHDRMNDYNVIWRGRHIGRIWRHEYRNHPREGLGPWHWYWQTERLGRETEGHTLTLEAAMTDFRRAWDRSAQGGEATARR